MYKANKLRCCCCLLAMLYYSNTDFRKKRRREDEIQKEAANVTLVLRTGQRNSTMRKGLFIAVWESTDWLLDRTSFKLIQLREIVGAQKGKFNTYQHCITSQRSHMVCIRNRGLPVLSHLHTPQNKTKRVNLPEPEIFTERVEVGDDKPKAVTTIHKERWQDRVAGERNSDRCMTYIYKCDKET